LYVVSEFIILITWIVDIILRSLYTKICKNTSLVCKKYKRRKKGPKHTT